MKTEPLKLEYNVALAEFKEAESNMLKYHHLQETTQAEKIRFAEVYKTSLAKVGNLSNEFPNASHDEILKGFQLITEPETLPLFETGELQNE